MASRVRRLAAVVATLLMLLVIWEVGTYLVAYTDDAYVRSDLVGVAPQVTGPVATLSVVDNQEVKVGDPLFTIDPTPFRLEVRSEERRVGKEC